MNSFIVKFKFDEEINNYIYFELININFIYFLKYNYKF